VRRREFTIALLGGAAAWPYPTVAQQPRMPVLGLLNAMSLTPNAHLFAALKQGLADAGYAEGRTLHIEYRWGDGKYDQLPAMAADLVRLRPDVIVATPTVSALAARRATSTIPIVFSGTDDPVTLGLVASFARPGGNATGVHFLLSDLASKQLGIIRELIPSATRIGLLLNPQNPNVESVARDVRTAAATIGVQVDVIRASDTAAIENAFATLRRNESQALVVGADPFFFGRRVQLTTLAARHGIPAIYNVREYAEAGGLIAYGTNLLDVFRQVAAYTVRILKGTKPADLPIVQSATFELVINRATARALGVDVPATMLARADSVID
jgi:putative ABC transport system substrate-binding protein